MRCNKSLVLFVFAACVALCGATCHLNADASQFLSLLNLKSGFAVVADNPEFALDIARRPGWEILALLDDGNSVLPLRLKSGDMLNKSLYAEKLQGLLVADHYADLLIIQNPSRVKPEEAVRALTPGGILFARGADPDWLSRTSAKPLRNAPQGWLAATKPLPEGMDSWSHWFHLGDNNPVSSDTVFRWPAYVQWTALPWRSPQPTISVVGGGVAYSIMGSAYANPVDQKNLEPDELQVSARNAFSGHLYWTHPIKEYQPVGRSAYVAEENCFYLLDDDRILLLDPKTGRTCGRK